MMKPHVAIDGHMLIRNNNINCALWFDKAANIRFVIIYTVADNLTHSNAKQ